MRGTTPEHFCCWTGLDSDDECTIPAAWTLWFGKGPEDATESCVYHVGALLGVLPLLNIEPIAIPPALEVTGLHWSDCGLHNEPAYRAEPCDCGANAPRSA